LEQNDREYRLEMWLRLNGLTSLMDDIIFALLGAALIAGGVADVLFELRRSRLKATTGPDGKRRTDPAD